MAVPVIEVIDKQTIVIDTAYSLEVEITGDVFSVETDGLLEGFYQSWDAAAETLTIATDEATRLLENAIWTISAKETESGTPVMREIEYDVVSAAPLIEEVGGRTLFKDFEVNIFVPVQNRARQVFAEGLVSGLKYEPASRGQGDEREEGIEIAGRIPEAANLTVDSFDAAIQAMNDGGMDTYNLPLVVSEAFPISEILENQVIALASGNGNPRGIDYDSFRREVLVVDNGPDEWFRYMPDGTYLGKEALAVDNSTPSGITYDPGRDEVLVSNSDGGVWYRYSPDGTELGTVSFSATGGIADIYYHEPSDEVWIINNVNLPAFAEWYRFERDGTLISSVQLGQNYNPFSIAWDPRRDEVLFLRSGRRIDRRMRNGTFIATSYIINTDNRNAQGLVVNTDTQELLVADFVDDAWYRYNIMSVVYFHGNNNSPTGAAHDSTNDEVLILDSGVPDRWVRYETDGTHLGDNNLQAGNTNPNGIAFDSVNTEVLVVDSATWFRYQTDGTYIGTRTLDVNNGHTAGITVDSVNAEVLVVGSTNNQWFRYETDGTFLGTRDLHADNDNPTGITFDSVNTEVLVVDDADGSWFRYMPDGTYIGKRARNENSTDPSGIAHVSSIDEVIIADRASRVWYRHFSGAGE